MLVAINRIFSLALTAVIASTWAGSCAKSAAAEGPSLDPGPHDVPPEDTATVTDEEEPIDTTVCAPPDPVADWGGPCDTGGEDCPADTRCVTVSGMPPEVGFCAPQCCQGDFSYCTDIGSGFEQCWSNSGAADSWFCVVVCLDDDDCVTGTTCQQVAVGTHICNGVPDADTDADTDSDTDTDMDADTDADTDSDTDTDTNVDTGTGSEVCAPADVTACDTTYAACQLACEDDTDPLDECVAACFEAYCTCIVGLGCDPIEYDCG